MAVISKITAKGQTIVPREVRAALKSKPGDCLAWEIDAEGHVAVRSVSPVDHEWLRVVEDTVTEWNTPGDEEAYRDL